MEEQNMLDMESLELVSGGGVDYYKAMKLAVAAVGPVAKEWFKEGGAELVRKNLQERGLDFIAEYFI